MVTGRVNDRFFVGQIVKRFLGPGAEQLVGFGGLGKVTNAKTTFGHAGGPMIKVLWENHPMEEWQSFAHTLEPAELSEAILWHLAQ